MAMNTASTSRELPCGRDPVKVWDDAASDSLSGHETICRYCQGVVSEYRLIADPLVRFVSESVEPPPGLLERVMVAVRMALHSREFLSLSSAYGPVRLDVVTAASVLRYAVDQVPGARARSCRILSVDTDQPLKPSAEPPAPPPVKLEISILAQAGDSIVALADDVREVLVAVGRELLGLDVAGVDVNVVDVYPAELAGGAP